ncbi:GspH/FimT family pseudopilin [Bacillus sp. NP157]|nr:GspH/FimT family pseudopilin [Bacillus sp. NP157]
MPAGRQRAYTLFEITLVIGILALLAAIAVPSMVDAVGGARLRVATQDLADTLNGARAAAIARQAPVTVCPSRDGRHCTDTPWQGGWIVRQQETILGVDDALPALLRSAARDGRPSVTFQGTGMTPNNTTVTLCVRKRPASALSVVVNRGGRVRIEPAQRDLGEACARRPAR